MVHSYVSVGRVVHAASLGAVLLLTGCADGLELNGKIFDWMGVSQSAQSQRNREPVLADRSPLVVPPDTNRLPQPGSEQAQTGMVWPDDPEQRKAREAQERQRLHLAYCRGDMQWKERALDPKNANVARSPYGPCPSLFDTSGLSKKE